MNVQLENPFTFCELAFPFGICMLTNRKYRLLLLKLFLQTDANALYYTIRTPHGTSFNFCYKSLIPLKLFSASIHVTFSIANFFLYFESVSF